MATQIVTANRLGDGLVIYLAQGGAWTDRVEDAEIARDEGDATALLARAEAPDQATRVVGPYLMAVIDEAGVPRPASNREIIRALGPSVRTDLGRQALTRASEG